MSVLTLVMLVIQERAVCVLCVCFRGGRGEEEGADVARRT